MKGAKSAQSRPYWIRYIVAFWSWKKLKWAKDNVLLACVCSLAPGLIVSGISAALSDHEWRAAAYATLVTYASLFVLFLMWRLIATPGELDRDRQRFINGLTQKLVHARLKLVALQASPPGIDVELLEIYVQPTDIILSTRSYDSPVTYDIFLRVKLRLQQAQPIEVLAYELSSVLHGNCIPADFADDIQEWGLVTEKKPIGVGMTFRYTISRLTRLLHQVPQRGIPVEGWLHYRVHGVRQKEISATVYRLTVLTPSGGISADIAGAKNLEGRQFQKIPCASHVPA